MCHNVISRKILLWVFFYTCYFFIAVYSDNNVATTHPFSSSVYFLSLPTSPLTVTVQIDPSQLKSLFTLIPLMFLICFFVLSYPFSLTPQILHLLNCMFSTSQSNLLSFYTLVLQYYMWVKIATNQKSLYSRATPIQN